MNENRRETSTTINREFTIVPTPGIEPGPPTMVPTYDSPFLVCRAVPQKPLSLEVQGYKSFFEADWATLNVDHDETVAMIDDGILECRC